MAELNPQLRFEQEAMVVRLSQVLEEAPLTPSEQADLYFERGVIYDSLGLWSLARYDFAQAISLNQRMAAAYNYMGLYLLLEGDYDSSIDAFNAVLELDREYSYTYLNRGLAFYYSGRYSRAQRDLLHFMKKIRKILIEHYGSILMSWNLHQQKLKIIYKSELIIFLRITGEQIS